MITRSRGWLHERVSRRSRRAPDRQLTLDRLREEEAIVPPIWQVEMANLLVVGQRRQRLTKADVANALRVLASLPIRNRLDHPIGPLQISFHWTKVRVSLILQM